LSEIILQSDYKNGELIIKVSDKGPGLPDELLPGIFIAMPPLEKPGPHINPPVYFKRNLGV
jgi:K+-sensing histidine kinase KdpD